MCAVEVSDDLAQTPLHRLRAERRAEPGDEPRLEVAESLASRAVDRHLQSPDRPIIDTLRKPRKGPVDRGRSSPSPGGLHRSPSLVPPSCPGNAGYAHRRTGDLDALHPKGVIVGLRVDEVVPGRRGGAPDEGQLSCRRLGSPEQGDAVRDVLADTCRETALLAWSQREPTLLGRKRSRWLEGGTAGSRLRRCSAGCRVSGWSAATGRWLRFDLVAGVVLAAILVPQGMAYAELAGLPPVTGLYTTIACLVGYALFGPSRVLVLGPDSSVSPLIFAAITPLLVAGGDPSQAIALAGMIALLVGLIEIGLGLGKLGLRRRPALEGGAGRLHERPRRSPSSSASSRSCSGSRPTPTASSTRSARSSPTSTRPTRPRSCSGAAVLASCWCCPGSPRRSPRCSSRSSAPPS